MRIPRNVLAHTRPSAPASSAARAISTMSVTLGLSLTNSGVSVHFLTADVTLAMFSAEVPNAMPPPCTLGQLTFSSRMSTCGWPSMRRQVSQYSSTEKPLMLAIIGPLYTLRSLGSSSLITLSTPGFIRPTELIIPDGHSATRGNGLPKRGSSVVPFTEMAPRVLRS